MGERSDNTDRCLQIHAIFTYKLDVWDSIARKHTDF